MEYWNSACVRLLKNPFPIFTRSTDLPSFAPTPIPATPWTPYHTRNCHYICYPCKTPPPFSIPYHTRNCHSLPLYATPAIPCHLLTPDAPSFSPPNLKTKQSTVEKKSNAENKNLFLFMKKRKVFSFLLSLSLPFFLSFMFFSFSSLHIYKGKRKKKNGMEFLLAAFAHHPFHPFSSLHPLRVFPRWSHFLEQTEERRKKI